MPILVVLVCVGTSSPWSIWEPLHDNARPAFREMQIVDWLNAPQPEFRDVKVDKPWDQPVLRLKPDLPPNPPPFMEEMFGKNDTEVFLREENKKLKTELSTSRTMELCALLAVAAVLTFLIGTLARLLSTRAPPHS